jgi:hypothetical protein
MNDYVVHRLRDVPAVWYEGLRFAAHWPRTEGALGLRHRQAMKRHRHTGDLVTTAWPAARFDKHEIWEQGKARVRRHA